MVVFKTSSSGCQWSLGDGKYVANCATAQPTEFEGHRTERGGVSEAWQLLKSRNSRVQTQKSPKCHLTEKFDLATQGQNSGNPQRGFPSSTKGRFSHAYKRGKQNVCKEDNTPSKSGSNKTNWNDIWFTRPCTKEGTWSCLRNEGKQSMSNDCFRHT